MLNRRALGLMSASGLAALVADPRSGRAAAKELRYRLSEDPETLYNVQSVSLTVNQTLSNYLLERLIYLDASGKPQPWLAESWAFSDDSRQVTFKLRPGVKFHDGTEFDSAAVKFHFDSILDPKNASPVRPLMAPLENVQALDPLTVRFEFSRPFAPFMILMGSGTFGFNSPAAVARYGRQYGRRPVGTGPYMFKSWAAGTELIFVRYPGFRQLRGDAVNKGAPYADQITLTVLPEEGVAFSALQTGELSAAELQTDAVERFGRDPNFRVVLDEKAKNLLFLEFSWRPPFDDLRVRDAISHAIDREAVVRAAYSGYATAALGPLSRGIPGYDDAVAKQYGTPYDPAKAKQLLAEAGWTDKGGGILSKDGREARFALRSYANPIIDRTLAVIQSNLAAIGVSVSLATSDWGTFYPGLLREGWDMDVMRWTYSDPSVMSNLFRTPGHRRVLPPDPELDRILLGVDTTVDPPERQRLVSEAQKALLERRMIVPIATNHNVYIVQSRLQNYTPDYLNYFIAGDVKMADW